MRIKRLPQLFLFLLTLSFLLSGCGKKNEKRSETFSHPRDGYTITIPDGWSHRVRDRVTYSILEILADTTGQEGASPQIVIISDDLRQPVDFDNLARDAGFKITVMRTSSHHFEVLDSSRVEVDGRTGIVYTYERVPKFEPEGSIPRHEVMIFLQANQGMISIKYIAPKPVAKQYAELFHRNLESFKIRDIGEPISEDEYQRLKQQQEMRSREMADPQPNTPRKEMR